MPDIKPIWQTQSLSKALGQQLNSDIKAGQIQFNSKDVHVGDLFIAMKGGARDGHEFVSDAINRGCAAAIVERKIDGAPEDKQIIVENTESALLALAEYKRLHLKSKFIVVTGSVGKTSTKEALGLMLSCFGNCFLSRGNFNNHLGVPINLASIPDDTDYAVIELGMNAPGEISALTTQVSPHMAIVTNVAPVHIEYFDSIENIADAKCEIYEGLDLNDGVAILNRDIDTYVRCVDNIDDLNLQNIRTFGTNEESDTQFTSFEIIDDNSVRLSYRVCKDDMEFVMPYVPEHIAANFSACFQVVFELDLDIEKASMELSKFKMGIGRGRLIESRVGDKKYKIIADYYNAGPTSMKASLENFAHLSASAKVVIFGDMAELGKDAVQMHKELSWQINNSGASKVILVGELSKHIKSDLNPEIDCRTYSDSDSVASDINEILEGGELVLIKGSRFMQLENVAKAMGIDHVF